MRMQAVANGTVVAESEQTVVVEGNHYFPPESVRTDLLSPTTRTSWCFWKGKATYYTVVADGIADTNAAWQYRRPFPLARRIKDHIAFWGHVEVRPAPDAAPGPVSDDERAAR